MGSLATLVIEMIPVSDAVLVVVRRSSPRSWPRAGQGALSLVRSVTSTVSTFLAPLHLLFRQFEQLRWRSAQSVRELKHDPDSRLIHAAFD